MKFVKIIKSVFACTGTDVKDASNICKPCDLSCELGSFTLYN